MHKKRTRPLLALLVLILASLACETPVATITKGLITCDYVGFHMFVGGHTYSCTCPVNGITTNLSLEELQSFEEVRLYRETCGGINPPEQPQPTATSTPTEEPTEEPAATEPPAAPAPLNPYLAGKFTTCDNLSRYVNFTIAENAPPYDPATTKVLFNGQPATCTPAASSHVLTCIYPPAPYGPPAIIEVFIGEEKVNEFNFDGGSICDPAPVPPSNDNNDDDPAPTEPPVPTEPPIDTGGD